MVLRAAVPLVISSLALGACSSDPIHSRQVDGLGGETSGVHEGPLHRPGQPCLACHGTAGPADTEFALAGTVYQDPASMLPLPDARVHLIDEDGKTYDAATNCAGNFFIMNTDYRPTYPVWVKVFFGTAGGQPVFAKMGSPIYRDGSCATCHGDPPGPEAVGHVYWSPDPIAIPPSPSCQ
ncbi:MAG TPA: hypothetical protein VHU80_04515 [Polyangiaceae bacterium]|jgi:hypothetical protein|nr:hypothetical protein [Polyangiaceae bacterium]